MAEEKHHHLFHHHKEEEKPVEAVTYSETAYGIDSAGQYCSSGDRKDEYEKEEKHHKHKEHLGEMGALASGAFALVSRKYQLIIRSLPIFLRVQKYST